MVLVPPAVVIILKLLMDFVQLSDQAILLTKNTPTSILNLLYLVILPASSVPCATKEGLDITAEIPAERDVSLL